MTLKLDYRSNIKPLLWYCLIPIFPLAIYDKFEETKKSCNASHTHKSGSLNVLMRPGKKTESTGTNSFVPSTNSPTKKVKLSSTIVGKKERKI